MAQKSDLLEFAPVANRRSGVLILAKSPCMAKVSTVSFVRYACEPELKKSSRARDGKKKLFTSKRTTLERRLFLLKKAPL